MAWKEIYQQYSNQQCKNIAHKQLIHCNMPTEHVCWTKNKLSLLTDELQAEKQTQIHGIAHWCILHFTPEELPVEY